ncbi:hypothetical protein G4H71_17485 [Rhodococcus triatomae]|uniref:Excreted virulence factor EspC, type VII ESX diderm n=1 Tax=Rhodococcus triatomae TaxID=300028 RepID=A0A1G8FI71_9NOCA|nr:type VII secretion target [Rhodococcus triatomae]QNG19490.1 hypothetical protein G4H72_12890 [Rhodococcus triatomae]QNG24595.1 hypothetical protein G4H71_17485 [Rhodococcus triatomae]SDH81798.1 Excreted virulence factor EspC, type VII ESX diderm [Rhodococcus triatomae]
MEQLHAETASIAAFGATTAAMSAELHAAGLGAAASGPMLLGPVFGLVGGDFLAAFAAAHAAHLASIERLSGVLAGISAAAIGSAADYDGTEAGNTAALGSAGAGLA